MDNTRIRYIKGDIDSIFSMVDQLPFKIEFKQLLKEGSLHRLVFTLPDTVKEFKSGEAIVKLKNND